MVPRLCSSSTGSSSSYFVSFSSVSPSFSSSFSYFSSSPPTSFTSSLLSYALLESCLYFAYFVNGTTNWTCRSMAQERLQGKVAVITGGASGIGEATAKLFTRYGAKVIVADVQDSRGQALCKELASSGTISYAHCDVTKESEVKDVVDYAVSEHGKLDIMFNNAGIAPQMLTPVLEIERSLMEKVFDVNVYGAFFGAKHAARVMIPAKAGSIIFTASAASVMDVGGALPYSCSKHAVVGLTTHLCAELGKYGIRVNCISPFMIHTGIFDSAFGSGLDQKTSAQWMYAASNLKEAALEVDDVAEAAAYLGSDESKYVSGLNLVVDGGYTKTNPSLAMVVNASATSS